MSASGGGRVLAVRLDSSGDVLLAGPAVRALAGSADAVDLLVSPVGEQAARLLPGVDRVLVFDPPWSGYRPPPVSAPAVRDLVELLRQGGYQRAVIFTSFHQSPLPVALLAKLAGIPYVAADSVDYPGSLLDLRHHRDGGHEVTAALALAHAAGGRLPPGDTGRLAVTHPLPDVTSLLPPIPYVVVHPSAAVPARAPSPGQVAAIVAALRTAGWPVVLTGTATDLPLTDRIQSAGPVGIPTGDRGGIQAGDSGGGVQAAGPGGVQAGGRGGIQAGGCGGVRDGGRGGSGIAGVVSVAGRTSFAGLAAVLAGAACVVVGNTGPAHLAAAVGTPVVSLFAPVVPVERWAPYGVPTVVLGDQWAPCRDSRARECPVPGHPCLSGITAAEVLAAVHQLAGEPPGPAAGIGEVVRDGMDVVVGGGSR